MNDNIDQENKEKSFELSNRNKICEIRQRILKIENQLHGIDLTPNSIVFDVPIEYKGSHFIHTIRVGDINNKKIIVMTHGYNSSMSIFCKVNKLLKNDYLIYIFDLIGHGLSSRESHNFTTTEEILDFYIESMEIWRKYLGIKKFQFAGHSMGGYIGVNYCLRYPDVLTKISMVSPAGITDPTPHDEIYKNHSIFQTFGFKLLSYFHGTFTVKGIYSSIGCLKKPLYDYLNRNAYSGAGKDIATLIKSYNYECLSLEGNIEIGLTLMFSQYVPLLYFPLENRLDKLHSSVDIYYGSEDWMERLGAERVIKRYPDKIKMIIVEEAGHNIFIDTPDKIANFLIENYDYVDENNRLSPKKKYNNLVKDISLNVIRSKIKFKGSNENDSNCYSNSNSSKKPINNTTTTINPTTSTKTNSFIGKLQNVVNEVDISVSDTVDIEETNIVVNKTKKSEVKKLKEKNANNDENLQLKINIVNKTENSEEDKNNKITVSKEKKDLNELKNFYLRKNKI